MGFMKYLVIFVFGAIVGAMIFHLTGTTIVKVDPQTDVPVYLIDAYHQQKDKASPADHIISENIKVFYENFVVAVPNINRTNGNGLRKVRFSYTKSMDPVLDGDSNAVQIVPNSKEDIHVGDIISYKKKDSETEVAHRVIDIAEDAEGWYVVAKGDNNAKSDGLRIRFDDITGVTVAIIY